MKSPLILLIALAAAAHGAKPNFVFILADDLGRPDLSGEGSTFHETPNIDRIASEGMRFENGYSTCQVCSPSRASIMTGKYPARHGITDYIGAPSGTSWKRNDKVLPAEYVHALPAADTTLAEALKAGGYTTFFAGKWHLGGDDSLPTDHGFDINVGGYSPGTPPGGFFTPYKNKHLEDGPAGESLPLRLGQETAKFIETHKDEPFLAYLSFYSVHAPIQTTEELRAKYLAKAEAQKAAPSSGERFKFDRTKNVRQVQDNPIYAGMMETMDAAVGTVLDALDRLGLAENTVVVFTGDNGGVSSGDAYATASLPFRGGKGRQWEGGFREPYYIKAPGVTQPGSETAVPATGTDFFPTILELAGLDPLPEQHVDGLSLVPVLKGSGAIPERALFWHYPHYGNQGGEPSGIIRDGDWKLIHYYEDGRDELYHLAEDVGEQTDLAGSEPDRTKALRAKLDAWLAETGAKIPEQDPRFDAAKKAEQLEQLRTKKKAQLEAQAANYLDPEWEPNKSWWGSKPTAD